MMDVELKSILEFCVCVGGCETLLEVVTKTQLQSWNIYS